MGISSSGRVLARRGGPPAALSPLAATGLGSKSSRAAATSPRDHLVVDGLSHDVRHRQSFNALHIWQMLDTALAVAELCVIRAEDPQLL
jgi:hypothetical protein